MMHFKLLLFLSVYTVAVCQGDVEVRCDTFFEGRDGRCTCTINATEADSDKCALSRPVKFVTISLFKKKPTSDLCVFQDYTTGQLDEHDSSATCSLEEPQSGNLYTLSVTVPANSAIYQGASVDCLPSCLDATFEYGLNTKYFGVPIHVVPDTQTHCPTYVTETGTLTCDCRGPEGSVSQSLNITWPGLSNTSELTISNVSREDNGTQYTCQMDLDGNITTSNYTLRVAYGPTDESMAITGPASIPTDGSQPVTLTCEVNDTYPVPRYTWTNVACDNGNKQKTCTFTPSFPGDDGRVVVCKAVNPQITLPAVENAGWAMFTLKFRGECCGERELIEIPVVFMTAFFHLCISILIYVDCKWEKWAFQSHATAPTRNDRKCTPVGHPVLAAVLYFLYIPGPVYIMIAAAVRSKWPFSVSRITAWRSLSIVFCMLIPEFMVLYVICAVIGKMWPFEQCDKKPWEIVLFIAGFLLCSGLVTLMTLDFVCGVPPPENCINTDSYLEIAVLATACTLLVAWVVFFMLSIFRQKPHST